MKTTWSNELALYDLLVFTGLKIKTEKNKEFAEKLSFALHGGFCLYTPGSEKDDNRTIGKSTFLVRMASTINKERDNKALFVSASTAGKELSIKRVNDESLDIITQYSNLDSLEEYTHIIFDEVSILNYERIKDKFKEATLLGIIV